MSEHSKNTNFKKPMITFLNCYGDLTIGWEEKDAAKVESMITKLLEEGHQFFIVKKRFLIPDKKIPLRTLKDLHKNEINASEDTIQQLMSVFTGVNATVTKDTSDEFDVVKGSIVPSEIVNSQSVCSKPARGG